MHRVFSSLGLSAAVIASAILATTSGCVSGGFKLTREYARWVNSKNIVLRVVLYILTFVVFAVTMIIDTVVFNTIDFWEGRVSQGNYEFQKDGKTFFVKHEVAPATGLRQSTIRIVNSKSQLLQEVLLLETANQKVQLFVDRRLRTEVSDIHSLPMLTNLTAKGKVESSQPLWMVLPSHAEEKVAVN